MLNNYQTALIGHTGFVGSNLLLSKQFDELYNSKNIEEITGKSFHKIVCAGVNAVKWWANQNPQQDKAQIDKLLNLLRTVKTDIFILISTVDVYREVNGVTEDDLPNPEGLHVYGRHRLYVEEFVKQNFSKNHIIRLPALFGRGLKKNIIYDLLNSNGLDVINPKSSFQWYPLERLSTDMEIIEQANIPLINLAAEPIKTETIANRYFPSVKIGSNPSPEVHYDMHTKYSYLFGQNSDYVIQQDDILLALEHFLQKQGV
jgi:hypothetical protein